MRTCLRSAETNWFDEYARYWQRREGSIERVCRGHPHRFSLTRLLDGADRAGVKNQNEVLKPCCSSAVGQSERSITN